MIGIGADYDVRVYYWSMAYQKLEAWKTGLVLSHKRNRRSEYGKVKHDMWILLVVVIVVIRAICPAGD